MSHRRLCGTFIEGGAGPIFILARQPSEVRGCVLVVPAFAEEMNKSRRMTTLLSMALGKRGFACVSVDLYGTGDSAGDFSEATLDTWKNDIVRAAHWCRDNVGTVTGLVACRFGATLAATVAAEDFLPNVQTTVLWQPIFDAPRFANQFLRLRIAAALLEQDRKETVEDLRAKLAANDIVEVAGYGLSGRLVAAMEAIAKPKVLPKQFGATHWMEIVREAGAQVPVPTTKLVDESRIQGRNVHLATFVGEPFWAATEIVENLPLVEATVAAFERDWASVS